MNTNEPIWQKLSKGKKYREEFAKLYELTNKGKIETSRDSDLLLTFEKEHLREFEVEAPSSLAPICR